jgi:hypothetical protein
MRKSPQKIICGMICGLGLLWLLLNSGITEQMPWQVWAVDKTGNSSSDSPRFTREKINKMNEELKRNGYSFKVGYNSVSKKNFARLCGTKPNHENYLKAIASKGIPVSKVPLPSKFDWRDQDGLTPVRDQGNCGSCWAFAAIGPLEANIKIKDHQSLDLSEQYIVSCNSNDWGCNGGFWPHDMFLKGAALEKDFPYRAADVPCRSVTTAYPIEKWGYVGTETSVPSTEAIKTAIYQYGPITVAVCADAYFDAYQSGVFNRSANGPTNHAVVLVGWDDSQGYWIMRNSWGTSWGESGYMRIAYGTSSIGEAAAYIVYKGEVAPVASPVPVASQGPKPEPEPGPEPSPNGGTALIDYNMYLWGRGGSVSIMIKNKGTTAINGWQLEFSFNGNQKITDLWNGTYTQNGTAVTITNDSSNAKIPAKGIVNLGFEMTFTGQNVKPTSFTLNGAACEIAQPEIDYFDSRRSYKKR